MEKKIVIIEDDSFLGDVLTQKLQHEGYDVVLVRDGKEGYETVSKIQPDLILLDIILPTLSGYEILEKLRADAALSRIPVIIISNSGQPVEIKRALALGVQDYLVKAQLDPEEVLTKVRQACNGGAQSNARGRANGAVASAAGRLAGKKILWVEDDLFLNDILAKKLTLEGCIPLNARDGEEAMHILEREVPDVVLLDLVLPGMSGFDVLQSIKASDRLKNVPVIVFSNLGQPAEIEKAKKLGAVKHLVKAEIDIGEVVSELEAVLK